jgi:hypothetical protein
MMMHFVEEEELSRVIEASIQSELHQESLRFARDLERAEIEAADEELARALETSARQDEETRDLEAAMVGALAQSDERRSQERNQGTWDCIVCTLTNDPYRPKCQACRSPPPPNVLVFSEMPQTINFGVELEFFVPHGKQDGFTLESIAQHLTQMGPSPVHFRGYTKETTNYWKIVTDASLSGGTNSAGRGDLCLELVSPVLQGEKGLRSLRTMIENIRRLGIGTNKTCSFHVHIDSQHLSLDQLKRISQCFVSLENAFDLLVSLSWASVNKNRRANRNRYCRSNRLAFGERSNRQRWEYIASATSVQQLVEQMNPGEDRYRKLNLTNLVRPSRPSTIEFRHYGGVEDIQEAEAWVRLLLIFCQNVSTQQAAIGSCLLPEGSQPKAEIRALFQIIDCPGLEQFFTIEKRLYHEPRLGNHWQCRVCRRIFSNSRGLAQHCAACGH